MCWEITNVQYQCFATFLIKEAITKFSDKILLDDNMTHLLKKKFKKCL